MSNLWFSDINRINESFVSDLCYMQEKLDRLAQDEMANDMLEYGGSACIPIFGISETLKRRIEQHKKIIAEIVENEQQKNK